MWLVQMGTPYYGVMPGEKAKVPPYSPFYGGGILGRWYIRWHHTKCTIYWRFRMMQLMSHSRQCQFAKCLPAEPSQQHQPSTWKGPLTKASGLDYRCTGTFRCQKVTGQIWPLHVLQTVIILEDYDFHVRVSFLSVWIHLCIPPPNIN